MKQDQEFENMVTLPLSTKPGGKESPHRFNPHSIILIKRQYYRSAKKSFSKIMFDKGGGLSGIVFSRLPIDDLMELLNASPILKLRLPEAYIRIPLKERRDEKQYREKAWISALLPEFN